MGFHLLVTFYSGFLRKMEKKSSLKSEKLCIFVETSKRSEKKVYNELNDIEPCEQKCVPVNAKIDIKVKITVLIAI